LLKKTVITKLGSAQRRRHIMPPKYANDDRIIKFWQPLKLVSTDTHLWVMAHFFRFSESGGYWTATPSTLTAPCRCQCQKHL